MPSNITTLAGLYTEATRLLDGEDPTSSDISVATLARLLGFAQRRIYREARTRFNQAARPAVPTTTSNALPLPADFESAAQVHFGGPVLQPLPEALLREKLDAGGSGDALAFGIAGTSLIFWPAMADGTVVQGRYWARLPDLTDANIASNALFQAADDLFLYALLVEAGAFWMRDRELSMWSAKYATIRDALNRDGERSAYSAGRMRLQPSFAVLR